MSFDFSSFLSSKKAKTAIVGIVTIILQKHFDVAPEMVDHVVTIIMSTLGGFAAQDVAREYRQGQEAKAAALAPSEEWEYEEEEETLPKDKAVLS